MMKNTSKYIFALGTFDGVHLGHQSLLKAAKEMAKEPGVSPAVYTFSDLPRAAVEGKKIGMLTAPVQKYGLLKAAGASLVIAEPFEKVRYLSPEEFVYYLVGAFGAEGFVCGRDFRFGQGGVGDAEALCRIAATVGKQVRVVDFLQDENGQKIASGQIRRYVEAGQPEQAAAALGRPFFVEGDVLHGKGLARQWGTPTINLPLPDDLVQPRFGVYATRVTVDGKTYPGVTNVGRRPTVERDAAPNVETYILEGAFERIDRAQVEFLRFIRPEMTFPDEKSLQLQIAKDIQSAKEL